MNVNIRLILIILSSRIKFVQFELWVVHASYFDQRGSEKYGRLHVHILIHAIHASEGGSIAGLQKC